MPSLSTLKAAMRFKKSVGIQEGSCFGALDPEALRPPFKSEEPNPPSKQEEKKREE